MAASGLICADGAGARRFDGAEGVTSVRRGGLIGIMLAWPIGAGWPAVFSVIGWG